MIGGGTPSRIARAADRRTVYRPEPAPGQPEAPAVTHQLISEPAPRQEVATQKRSSPNTNKSSKAPWIIAALSLVIALATIGWYLWSSGRTGLASDIDSNKYQAVFLVSGQVYFGRLEEVNDQYVRLREVFYIQSGSTASTDGENPESSQDANMRLIKLGDEVHAPEDAMVINRDQVLFFENLKPNGRVVQLIQSHSSGNN